MEAGQVDAEQAPPSVVPRDAGVRRLLLLDGEGRLTKQDIGLAAGC